MLKTPHCRINWFVLEAVSFTCYCFCVIGCDVTLLIGSKYQNQLLFSRCVAIMLCAENSTMQDKLVRGGGCFPHML